MPASRRRFLPHTLLAAVVLLAAVGSSAIAYALPLPNGPNDFNSPGFIVRHVWVKFAMLATRPLRGEMSAAQQDAQVARFFDLNAAIAEQERIAGDPASSAQISAAATARDRVLRSERDGIQNSVQLILEGRLTKAIEQAGLTRHAGGDFVWPPVNIQFQDPPSVLVRSPRDEIRVESEQLLQGNLPIDRVERLEAAAQADGKTSALVVQIGGIAMYPAIIPYDSDYSYIMQDIAHEWTHHYLFFTPLGRRYFASAQLTTLNETVADIVGRELGDRLVASYPLPATASPAPSATATPQPGAIDFTAVMRGLHTYVVALLKQGKVTEAEALMERTRQYLAAHGYYIRKLNQAYFAFHGSYADTAGSIDPIGPKLDRLRTESASLKVFVERAQNFTSEADLNRALAATR
ncbi:MAG TPA: hypothetical protein VEZ14_04780 [Dehalococcoidia bacterium]|nr:hypothetical protein [Dehalococcoidia bacterium]